VETTIPSLPSFNLSQRALQWDAFAMVQQPGRGGTKNQEGVFWEYALALRQNFTDLYGDEMSARALLDRGLTLNNIVDNDNNNNSNAGTRIPKDLQSMACRIQRAKREHRPFVMSFGGYSVTTGRGNYFHQSYPMVLKNLLQDVFTTYGVQLQVHNAAIGGCPSFPYGWCLTNFLGKSPDVVSWDFAMNEAGGDPMGLEAWLRRIWHDFGHTRVPPQLIIRDTHLATDRQLLLHNYSHWFMDSFILHTDPAAAPYLQFPEPYRPKGFRSWRTFGAPNGAPGQALHHPAVAEHKLMAYLLAMHFLSALELLVLQEEIDTNRDTSKYLLLRCTPQSSIPQSHDLPVPLTWDEATAKMPSWESLFVGDPEQHWKMRDIECRTSFEPIMDGSDLTGLVVAGGQAEDLDILKPRSKMFYNNGWTLDLAHDEKQAKKNLLRYGGLGFLDSKKAYYGIEMSGWLRLLLPVGEPKPTVAPKKGDQAIKHIASIVVCEVNDKTTTAHMTQKGQRCRMDQDVEFWIGGVNATNSVQPILAGGALYLGKKVCYYLKVPEAAQLTTESDLFDKALNAARDATIAENKNHITARQKPLHPEAQLGDRNQANTNIGLAVEVRIHNPHIVQVEQACSISHIVWEKN
jgi:hypothetical protein